MNRKDVARRVSESWWLSIISLLTMAECVGCGGTRPPPSAPATTKERSVVDDRSAPAEEESVHDSEALDEAPAPEEEASGEAAPPAAASPSPAPPSPAPETRVSESLATEWRQLDHNDDELVRALSGNVPDCANAERYRDAVCSLARRICGLAKELPSTSRANAQCDDSMERCRVAHQRYAARCD